MNLQTDVEHLVRAAMAVGAALGLSGCGAFAMAPSPDSLDAWSARPLPPDPGLTAIAVGENAACRLDDNPADNAAPPLPQVLVQDRRTANIAAFLVQNPDHFGSCMVSRSGEAGGGFGNALEPMAAKLTIDDRGSGTIGDGFASQLGGRVALPGAGILVRLDDGREVVASVSNGFWLVWWPSTNRALEVVAVDGGGAELLAVEVVDP